MHRRRCPLPQLRIEPLHTLNGYVTAVTATASLVALLS